VTSILSSPQLNVRTLRSEISGLSTDVHELVAFYYDIPRIQIIDNRIRQDTALPGQLEAFIRVSADFLLSVDRLVVHSEFLRESQYCEPAFCAALLELNGAVGSIGARYLESLAGICAVNGYAQIVRELKGKTYKKGTMRVSYVSRIGTIRDVLRRFNDQLVGQGLARPQLEATLTTIASMRGEINSIMEDMLVLDDASVEVYSGGLKKSAFERRYRDAWVGFDGLMRTVKSDPLNAASAKAGQFARAVDASLAAARALFKEQEMSAS
jgi:hypothetical protein